MSITQQLIQATTLAPPPYIGLLILGIVLAIVGWAVGRGTAVGQPLWTVIFWIGIALIIIWVILAIMFYVFGAMCC